ncbi:MAG: glycosyltransferase family 2 protein, partial [Candidatus Latescibacterota bacterium]
LPSTEVLFDNDASTDQSGTILDQLAQQYDFMRVLHLPNRSGQTGCYQAAFNDVNSDYIIRMDGDLQDDPKDLPHFFKLLDQDPDIIMGLRSLRRHRRMLRIVTLLYDILMLSLFDTPFHTNSSSFIAYKAQFVQNIPFKRNDHRYLPIIAIHRGAQNLHEISIKNRNRKYGKTKYGYYSKFLKGIPEVLRFLFRLKRGYYDVSPNTLFGDSK